MSKVFDKLALFFLFLACLVFIFGIGFIQFGSAKIDFGPVGIYIAFFWIFSKFASQGQFNNSSYLLYLKYFNSLFSPQNFFAFFIATTIYFFILHLFRHWSFNTSGYDMAFVHQALFNLFSPKLLYCNVCQGHSYLGEHLAFTLILPGLITSFIKSNELIFLIQSLLITTSCWILIKNLLPENKKIWTIGFIFIFCHMSLHNSLIWDFREDHLTFLFVSLMIIGLYKSNFILVYINLCLALLTKEHMGLLFFFTPMVFWFSDEIKLSKKQKILHSISICALSTTYFIVAFKYLIPHFTVMRADTHPITFRYHEFGSSPFEILINLLTTPSLWVNFIQKFLLSKETAMYPLLLLGPLSYWGRKHWPWMFPVFVGVFINMFGNIQQKSLGYHYDLAFLPFLFAAFLLAAKNSEFPNWSKRFIVLLLFSGSWPFSSISIPSLNNIKDVIYFKNFEQNISAAASMKTLAHLTPLLQPLELFSEGAIDSFIHLNSIPYGKGQNIPLSAQKIVLDNEDENEKKIAAYLQTQDFKVLDQSPSQRFLVLTKIR